MNPTSLITRRYRKVDPSIWQDPRFTSLSPILPSAQALLIFLLSCREGHLIPGVIFLGLAAMAEILNWTAEATRKVMDELIEAGEVLVDTRARLIFLRRAVAENPPANPNVISSWATTWHEAPACELKQVIWNELVECIRPRGQSFLTAFLTACPSPSGNGIGNGSPNRRANQEPEPDHEQEHEQELEPDQDTGVGPGVGWSGIPDGHDSHGNTGGESGVGDGAGFGPASIRTPIDDLTLDDVMDLPAGVSPSLSRESAVRLNQAGGPHAPPEDQRAAWAVIEAWNTQVAKGSRIFEAVVGKDAEALVPVLQAALKDPGAAEDFQDLFTIIPMDSFYQGSNDKNFTAFLRHYANQSFETRHKAAEIARKKLARLNPKKSTSRSETEAAEALKRARSSSNAPGRTVTNDLESRLGAGK